MKAILTLVLLLIFGATAMAHLNLPGDEKDKTHAVDHVLDCGTDILVGNEEALVSDRQIVRVYRSKNSRVKKALRFATKKSRPKLT